jgi:hypothetical protein
MSGSTSRTRGTTTSESAWTARSYNQGGHTNPWLSKTIEPLGLTADEQADLVAFLHSLTGEVSPEITSAPRLP